jgi:hypothetical protein
VSIGGEMAARQDRPACRRYQGHRHFHLQGRSHRRQGRSLLMSAVAVLQVNFLP